MSPRKRLFFGIVVLFALGVTLLLYRVAGDLDSRYRESTEETLVDAAYLLATMIETDVRNGAIDVARLGPIFEAAYRKDFEAKIFGVTKRRMDFQVYVTDAKGIVLFDSKNRAQGQDYSRWNDVRRVLAGQYGARTSLEDPKNPASTVMHVAAPVVYGERIIGVVSVGKPTASQFQFVDNARQKLFHVGLIAVAAFLFFLIMLSVWLTRPFGLTSDLVRIVRQDGLHRPAKALRRAKGVMGATFNDMRDVLAGRSFTEEYVQTLTHELKSPLSAIRGAAELLREPLPESQRDRFIDNIREQVQRLQDLADRLLKLASLEKQRTLEHVQPVDLPKLVREAVDAIRPAAQLKRLALETGRMEEVSIEGDRFLLYQAMSNILSNAVDFAPEASRIDAELAVMDKFAQFIVRDHGPGIPEYALDHVFEKFYSLPRPGSGRKSTGLGLAFVREIAELHGGKASIANHPEGGAIAILRLPLAGSAHPGRQAA